MRNAAALIRRLADAGVPHVDQSDSAEYDKQLKRSFTPRPDAIFKPAVFALPQTVEQVSAAVQIGAELGYKVVARSGGHSSCGISLGGQDGQLVLDLGHFDQIEVDAANQTAILGAGTRVGPVCLRLDKEGQALAMGLCPAVGIGGHLSGSGGFQAAHRTHGMSMDAVYAYDAVLADGSIVHVTQDSDPDLFWALRGFAASYAIVTRFHVKTWSPPPVQSFVYVWILDSASVVRLWKTWHEFVRSEDAVREFGALAMLIGARQETLLPPGHFSVVVHGNYLGTKVDFERHFATLKAQLPPKPVLEKIDEDKKWIDLVEEHKSGLEGKVGLDLWQNQARWSYYERSFFLTDDLPESAMQEALDRLAAQQWDGLPYSQRPLLYLDLVGGHDSFVNQVPLDSSSLPRRKDLTYHLWLFFFHFGPDKNPDEVAPEHRKLIDDLHAIIAKHAPGYTTYANVPDVGLDDAPRRYFGDNLPRLSELKRRYDKDDIFSTPLTVPLALRRK